MAQITSREELEAWLKDKPADWAQVIAARAALRVLPYAFGELTPENRIIDSVLPLIRAISISWAARNFPAYDMAAAAGAAAFSAPAGPAAAGAAAFSAAFSGPASAADAARAVEIAAYSARAASSRSASARSAARGAAYYAPLGVDPADEFNTVFNSILLAAYSAFWAITNHDCDWLSNETDARLVSRRLTHEPLWPAGEPDGWDAAWNYAAARLRELDQGYDVWIEWYNLRIKGERAAFDIPGDSDRTEDKAILARLADATDEDFWGKGATYVNTTLQSWIDEARERLAVPDSVSGDEVEITEIRQTGTSERIDFFISYSTKEETMAREVEAILSERGYTSIAQFKDFAQVNWARAMRDGIAASDRFIALQSKSYWESDYCQSEWDAAYARDPSAKQRKIVPFLLEPAPLPPIASELVHKSLFGLSKAKRKKAIIEWVEYQPPSRSRQQLRKALGEQANPDIYARDGKIDAGSDTLFDKVLVDVDLAELPGNLRELLKTIIASLPANAPPSLRNCLSNYRKHLAARGAQPYLPTIVPYAEAIKALVAADAGYWDAGLEILFASFLKRHQLLITHFPLNYERELLISETPIDEDKAYDEALLKPVEAVSEALDELRSVGRTTDNFDAVEKNHREFSGVMATLPRSEQTKGVTPKRRYVLGTIGHYERLLAALGAAAGVAALPQGQAAIAAVSSAIETFMGFIL